MSLLAIEGFEGGGTTNSTMQTYIDRRYANHSATDQEWAAGRRGGNGIMLDGASWFAIEVDNKQTIIVGFAAKFESFASVGNILNLTDNAGVWHVTLDTVAGGELRLMRGGAVQLAITVGLAMSVDTWYYFELKVKIDNTTGTGELHVNGTTEFDVSAVDTQNSGVASTYRVAFQGNIGGGVDAYYDDIYVLDPNGSVNNDFLGDCNVKLLSPDADTADADFTPSSAGDNFADVDDGATIDDDSTYVSTTSDAQKDIYDYADLVDDLDIYGVQISTECREDDATDYAIITIVKSGATESPDSQQALTSNYIPYQRVVEVDPDTSALWTFANINAAQFGFESVSI